MKLLSGILKREKRKCLICEKSVGKDFAEVQYVYKGGLGFAFLCSKCGDEFDKTNIDKESGNDLAV